LSDRQRTNAKHRAAFAGNRIILRQTSPEAETLFDLIIELVRASDGDVKSWLHELDLADDELEDYLVYAAMVLDNMGNYKVIKCPECCHLTHR
jgi:dipeptidyl-peptidase-3